jgi:hypothetical protein
MAASDSAGYADVMCNLYSEPAPNAFEDYIRRHRGQMPLPGWPLPPTAKPTVGPFDTGVFLTATADGQLVAHAGRTLDSGA